jgi:hypothetical protein
MKGRLKDLTFGSHGEQYITITVTQDFRQSFDLLKDSEINVQIKKWREPRSKDANAYAWVLIDKIAAAVSVDKERVYKDAIRSIGGVSETICVRDFAVEKLRESWSERGIGWQTDTMPSKIEGCTNVVLYFGSSTYDTKQMSLLIDHLIQDAKNLGIETMPPDKLNRLLENE